MKWVECTQHKWLIGLRVCVWQYCVNHWMGDKHKCACLGPELEHKLSHIWFESPKQSTRTLKKGDIVCVCVQYGAWNSFQLASEHTKTYTHRPTNVTCAWSVWRIWLMAHHCLTSTKTKQSETHICSTGRQQNFLANIEQCIEARSRVTRANVNGKLIQFNGS